jgi:hypothetical protein
MPCPYPIAMTTSGSFCLNGIVLFQVGGDARGRFASLSSLQHYSASHPAQVSHYQCLQ